MRKLGIAIAFLLLLSGCDAATELATLEEMRFEVIDLDKTGISGTKLLVDKETGVEYLIYRKGSASTITPLYNANGTLKVRESEENNNVD